MSAFTLPMFVLVGDGKTTQSHAVLCAGGQPVDRALCWKKRKPLFHWERAEHPLPECRKCRRRFLNLRGDVEPEEDESISVVK